MTVVRSLEGQPVDLIVWEHYGYVDGALEQVMDENPHLWLLPTHLPEGIEITLPIREEVTEDRLTRLWDT
jgi:phage tail protein X